MTPLTSNTIGHFTRGLATALAAALLLPGAAHSAEPSAREPFDIAITVDDLPAHGPLPAGMTRAGIAAAHIAAFKAHGVPEAFGFVNGKKLESEPGTAAVLDLWRQAGHPLGNHAYSHMNLDRAPSLAAWQADVAAGEAAVSVRMAGADWHYFRYPHLSAGNDPAVRAGALAWLQARGYRVADVSAAFSDWDYTDAYARCVARNDQQAIEAMKAQYLRNVERDIARMKQVSKLIYGRIIPQVLLTHIGGWSAATLPEVLDRLDAAGARYVTLAQAQADAAYAQPGGGNLMMRAARQQNTALPPLPPDVPPLDLQSLCR
jgi:peptidoglycan/xylan/chitin deacetylase (PgdA/CDA1 family)